MASCNAGEVLALSAVAGDASHPAPFQQTHVQSTAGEREWGVLSVLLQLIPLILSDEAIISQISWFYPRRLLFPKTGLVGVLSS